MLRALQDGLTALLHAADSGHSDVVGLLLDRGANMEAKDNVSRLPALTEPRGRPSRSPTGSLRRSRAWRGGLVRGDRLSRRQQGVGMRASGETWRSIVIRL